MQSSRKTEDLLPAAQAACDRHRDLCAAAGIDLLVYSTYRDKEAQNALYAKGRTLPGRRVTNARGGWSWHQWRVAYDCVPIIAGKAVWGTSGENAKLWDQVGTLGEQAGLDWSGRWRRLKEMAHFQLRDLPHIEDVIATDGDILAAKEAA